MNQTRKATFFRLDHAGRRGINLNHLHFYYLSAPDEFGYRSLSAVLSNQTVVIPRSLAREFFYAVKSKETVELEAPSQQSAPTFYLIANKIVHYRPNGRTQLDVIFEDGRTLSFTDPADITTFEEYMQDQ
jgi:hypothetical protein